MCGYFMATAGNDIKQIISNKYYCEKCDYGTCRKSNIDNHYNSAKHLNSTIAHELKQKLNNPFMCKNCDKIYKDRTGLWKHHKKCNTEPCAKNDTTIHDLAPELVKLITELVKGQSGLQESILELCKNGTHNNTTNNNSHNKTFNLQFFLNETCKDAMNIMEFVDSIKLQLFDLENVGQVGYVEGISNIIVKNLNALDINKRPVHCTDKKREVMYVKDENKWEKENDDKKKIRKMIKYIASKNQRMLPKFKEAHPDCSKSISRFSDKYNKILVESMGGSGDNDLEKEDKIIRNISKNILVNKEP